MRAAFLVSLLLSTQFGFAQGVYYSPGAVIANQSVSIQNGAYLDSYDSSDPAKSTGGKYDPLRYRGDNANVFCDQTEGVISLQNSRIYGRIYGSALLGLGIGPSAAVGSHEWQSNNVGIEPGWALQGMYPIPPTSLPDITGMPMPSGPFTLVTLTATNSTNLVTTSTSYFDPWPGQIVTTNIVWTTNDSYPGPIDGLVTNPGPAATTVVCPNYPAPGTYIGPVSTNSQFVTRSPLPVSGCYLTTPAPPILVAPGKYNFYQVTYSYYPILNYAFPTTTYNYWEISTNLASTTNVYDYVLSGYTHYVSPSLSGKSVYVDGSDITLVLPNGLNGTESFTLWDGASLHIYSGGITVALNGAHITGNVAPARFIVSCASNVTSLVVSGAFTGEIVAPNANATLQGDFSGLIMADKVTVASGMGFHFDESLLLADPAPGINYSISGGVAYIVSASNIFGNIVIPSTHNGFPVTSIAQYAFHDCTNLASITIPDSVTNISVFAFQGCTSLTNVTLGSGINNIEFFAFHACQSLTSITFKGNAPVGDIFMFAGVPQNAKVYYKFGTSGWGPTYYGLPTEIATGVVSYMVSGGVAYVVSGPDESGNTVIASTYNGYPVVGISAQAFASCAALTSVTIPNTVTNIDDYAFAGCWNLTQATLGSGITSIGDWAFAGCSSLTNITFSGNAPTGDTNIFSAVAPDAKVFYYYGTTGWGPTYYGLPTVMLGAPPAQIPPGNIGVTPGGFGFTINGVANQTIVIEASTNLVDWQPVWTNTLSGTSADFVDPESTNFPSRFYRARSN